MVPDSRRSGWLRGAGILGILTPIFSFTFIFLAIASYPQFSWVDNALSDLGVVSGVTSTLFNFGLCLGGLFAMIFAAGLFTFIGDRALGKIGSAVFFLASLSLEGIGLFPENARPFHFIFSVAFFTLMPIALLTIVGYYAVSRKKQMAVFTLLIAVAAALPWVLLFLVRYVSGVAIPELASAIAGAVWAIAVGYKMFKETSRPQKP
jgi:hypothetical membrane protein